MQAPVESELEMQTPDKDGNARINRLAMRIFILLLSRVLLLRLELEYTHHAIFEIRTRFVILNNKIFRISFYGRCAASSTVLPMSGRSNHTQPPIARGGFRAQLS